MEWRADRERNTLGKSSNGGLESSWTVDPSASLSCNGLDSIKLCIVWCVNGCMCWGVGKERRFLA